MMMFFKSKRPITAPQMRPRLIVFLKAVLIVLATAIPAMAAAVEPDATQSQSGSLFDETEAVFESESASDPVKQVNSLHRSNSDDIEASFDEQAADFGDHTEAQFDEQAADIGDDTEAQFELEEAPALSLDGPVAHAASISTSTPMGPVRHVSHYHPAQHFPERQRRLLQQAPHIWMLPLLLVACIAGFVTAGKNQLFANLSTKLRRRAMLIIFISLVGIMPVGNAHALTYSSIKDAVVGALGKDQKIYQSHIQITPEIRTRFQKKIGWTPKQNSYKVYYNKTQDGKPQRYAFILSDKLDICGGLHKYCVTIDAEGRVRGVKIVELTCDRSYCINTRSFLSQFKKFDIRNHSQKSKTYDAISGATLSTDLTRDIVLRALALYKIRL